MSHAQTTLFLTVLPLLLLIGCVTYVLVRVTRRQRYRVSLSGFGFRITIVSSTRAAKK